jgi:hypothetical protein
MNDGAPPRCASRKPDPIFLRRFSGPDSVRPTNNQKESTMGYSTPKKPFDMSSFLAQKGTPRLSWKRRLAPRTPPQTVSGEVVVTAPDKPES